MKTIQNGCEIFYLEEGCPDSLPVVFIHGMLFDHHTWRPQIDALCSRFRAVAWDMRGHGESGTGDGQYTHRMFAEDLIAVLDHLGIERAVLCGLSMGGSIAVRAFELDPGRICGLVLCDTGSGPDSDEAKRWRELAIRDIKRNGLKMFAGEFMEKVFSPAALTAEPEMVKAVRTAILALSPLAVCGALLAQAGRPDMTAALSAITIPTLLLVGEDDLLTPPSLMYSMHMKIPRSEVRVIPGAGHASNLENPSLFNKYLLEFLERNF